MVCQGKFTHEITTEVATNSFDQEPLLDHPVRSAFPAIAHACHFTSPTTIDDDSESSLTTHHGPRKEFTTNGGQCTYIFRAIARKAAPTDTC
jgi:hypothetical protein